MEPKYYEELMALRLERAEELLSEAQDLYHNEKYKSANNRAYYAIEKAIKALLLSKGIDAVTHSGNLKQFNIHFIYKGDGTFTPDDYQMAAGAEQIRNLSDYDDFYIASKKATLTQIQNAQYLVDKIQRVLNTVADEKAKNEEKPSN